MKRIAIGLVIGLLAGGIAGFGTGIFVYPFWFLNDIATEALAPDTGRKEVATGEFIHANTMDPVHFGSGAVSIYQEASGRNVVFLNEDFKVGPGPRFHVYLVNHAKVRSRKDFLGSDKVDLGRLRAFSGSQVYGVSADVEISAFKSVVIWCKEFGVLISPATLMPPQSVDQKQISQNQT